MKKIAFKLALFVIPVILYVAVGVFVDAYNVFHVNDIRFTYATPNQNFIKTKYVLENKDNFNAFVFGSSRAANLPKDYLPETTSDGRELNWYNMTYAMGCIEENYETVKTFIDGGVRIDELVVLIDEISMYRNKTEGRDNLIFTTYQTYEESPLKFYYSYIKQKPVFKLIPSVFDNILQGKSNNPEHMFKKQLFYSYGVDEKNIEMDIGENTAMFSPEAVFEYSEASRSIAALEKLRDLCELENIELIVVTTPILESTYRDAVSKGYLEFLTDVADVVPYYCFSGLNKYTTNADYYFDASHFRPYVGAEMEKAIFGNYEGKELVTKDNVNEIIKELRTELQSGN